MELVERNLVRNRVLHVVCGAFYDRWHEVSVSCGKDADAQTVDWGKANSLEDLRTALSRGIYDTVCMVYSETSTSVLNPVPEMAAVMRDFPDVVFCLDVVSALGVTSVPVDEWGVDLCFASVQKGVAMPPGVAIFSVCEKAMQRARTR